MNIDDLLDMMDETLEDAFTVPLSGKRMVDAEKLQDIINDIRLNMPTEIRQAKAIVQDRAEIVAGARKEAEGIIKKAEDRAAAMVDQEEIVRQSKQKAAEIMNSAQAQSREIRTTTTNFCESILRQTEEQLTASCADVKKVRATLRQRKSNVPEAHQ